jgi:hypothetical protein
MDCEAGTNGWNSPGAAGGVCAPEARGGCGMPHSSRWEVGYNRL